LVRVTLRDLQLQETITDRIKLNPNDRISFLGSFVKKVSWFYKNDIIKFWLNLKK